jgi:Sulfotransferase family
MDCPMLDDDAGVPEMNKPQPTKMPSLPLRPDKTNRPVRAINIVGMRRSGSTLVELVLDQLPGFVSVGELRYLWFRRLAKEGNVLCGCRALLRECPFWERVGQEAFGGWDQVDAAETLALQSAVERERYNPLLINPRLWPAYERKLRRYSALLARLFRAIQAVSGARVVVDASKLLSHAFVLRHVEALDVAYLHIVRDCRGVAFSWGKRVARPEAVGEVTYMPRYRPTKVAARWTHDNCLAHLLAVLADPPALMRYETFVQDPREELTRALGRLGEGEAAEALPDLGEGVRLEPTHSVCGNPLRFRTGTLAIELDDQWRREMRRRDLLAVTLVAWPLLRMYGYTLRDRQRQATPAEAAKS